jgi:hypothetical protein
MINSFFGKKDRPKKKKKTIESMSASPSPSVSPEEAVPEAGVTSTPASSP